MALIAPSAVNDLAFTQSMAEALNSLKAKYNLEIAVSDNQFVVATTSNVDPRLRVAGLQPGHRARIPVCGSTIQALTQQIPKVSLAWGTPQTPVEPAQ